MHQIPYNVIVAFKPSKKGVIDLAVIVTHYPTLLGLPGVFSDNYGYLEIKGAAEKKGLRYRYEYAIQLEASQLKSTSLPELLNWMRWGSIGGVMWECTLDEMVKLIEHWEKHNFEREIYGVKPNHNPIDWDELWLQAIMTTISPGYICPRCNTVNSDNTLWTCRQCGFFCLTTSERKDVYLGPRGMNTYNLALQGADGWNVANAAYFSRGKVRSTKIERLTFSPA